MKDLEHVTNIHKYITQIPKFTKTECVSAPASPCPTSKEPRNSIQPQITRPIVIKEVINCSRRPSLNTELEPGWVQNIRTLESCSFRPCAPLGAFFRRCYNSLTMPNGRKFEVIDLDHSCQTLAPEHAKTATRNCIRMPTPIGIKV